MPVTLDAIKTKLIGKTFGRLTVVDYVGRNAKGYNLWTYRCSCGTEMIRGTDHIKSPSLACVECAKSTTPKAVYNRSYLLGKKFGRLTVVECKGPNKYQAIKWYCKCDCGGDITTSSSNLITGKTQSCGCYGREQALKAVTTHGLHDHPLYAVWAAMKDRCCNENNERYDRYGGRGIRVCDDWLSGFENFYRWAMSKGYKKGLTLERTDNNGNYEPGNCRWATMQEQCQNTSRTKMNRDLVLKIREDPRTNMVIAKELGVDESTITRIKNRVTWSNV